MTEIECSTPFGPVRFRAEDWYAVHDTALLHRRRWVASHADLEVSFLTFPTDDLDTVRRHAREALARAAS